MNVNAKLTLLGASSSVLGLIWFAASLGVFCLAGMALRGSTPWSLVGWCFGLAFLANLLARVFDGMKERLTLAAHDEPTYPAEPAGKP